MVRCFSAWDHGKGYESGTFLKTIALLPLIKEMGFNGIYFLPVFELSRENKKGEISSPYAIRNIMSFDKYT
jgi:glycosidase